MIHVLHYAPLLQAPQDPGKHWQLPEKASTFADDYDALYAFVEWTCYFFFVGIMAVLVYSVVKYRRRTPDQPPASTTTHHTALEVTWTVIPLIIVMVIFAWGWRDMSDMLVAPADSLQYEVSAKRWSWQIKHPGSSEYSGGDFWVPLGQPCQLTMRSEDVLHSFFIPAFRVKRDVLPGRYQTVWFNPTVLSPKGADGKSIGYHLFCTEYCGLSHSTMIGRVHVVTPEEFATKPWENWSDTDLAGNGKKVFEANCKSCHTATDAVLLGPGMKGLYERTLSRLGIAPTDANAGDEFTKYVTESIRNPNAYIVPGFAGKNMTPFSEAQLSDDRVEWVAEYLKTLK